MWRSVSHAELAICVEPCVRLGFLDETEKDKNLC